MVERTVGGRTAAEIVARRRAIEDEWQRKRAAEAEEARERMQQAPSEPPQSQPPGFLQTVSEVYKEHPTGFLPVVINYILRRGEFTKPK